jgi:DNA-3-methyladenine glycosylase II
LREVASLAIAGEFADLEERPDLDVIARLRSIKGIGPWTAQMFLIFSLARPDVWPTSDAGLKAAASRLYGATSKASVEQLGFRFRPKRSLAALYLWRSLENASDADG